MYLRISFVLFLILLGSVPAPAPAAPIIDNPSAPIEGNTKLATQLLWSFGDSEDDPLLGYVNQVLETGDRFYLLDAQLSTIHVLNEKGELLQSFGRKGEGPGEFGMPQGMFLMCANRIAVPQFMPPRISMFSTDGEILDDLKLDHEGMMLMIPHGAAVGDGTMLELQDMMMEESGIRMVTRLVRLNTTDQIETTYVEHSHSQTLTKNVVGEVDEEDFSGMWTTLSDGRVAVSARYHEYQLDVYRPDGELDLQIRRDAEPVRQDPKFLETMRKRVEASAKARGQSVDFDPDPFQRAVQSVVGRPNGELWVMAAQSDQEEHLTELGPYDVFDPSGHLVRRVSIATDINSKRDRAELVGDYMVVTREYRGAAANYLAGMTGGATDLGDEDEEGLDDEPMRIEVYRIVSRTEQKTSE